VGTIKLDVPHSLGLEEAKKRVMALFDYWGKTYGVRSAWSGDSATFAGKAIGITFDGTLSLTANKVSGEAADPGMLIRGQAQKYLTRKLGHWLDPHASLESLVRGDD
jgi:Putative polyhydroxyalkanoic acid system protein (PHA_gran_rgn)